MSFSLTAPVFNTYNPVATGVGARVVNYYAALRFGVLVCSLV